MNPTEVTPATQMTLGFMGEISQVPNWTDDDIDVMREGILTDAIQTLFDTRTAYRQRTEILGWMTENPKGPEHPDLRVSAAAEIKAFSFVACCYAAHIDPDALTDVVRDHLRRLVKEGVIPLEPPRQGKKLAPRHYLQTSTGPIGQTQLFSAMQ